MNHWRSTKTFLIFVPGVLLALTCLLCEFLAEVTGDIASGLAHWAEK